jgi:hypothetical protein
LHNRKEKHGNSLFEFTNNIVINWWNEEKTIFPNCKDVIRRSIGIKFYESYATQYIHVSQK